MSPKHSSTWIQRQSQHLFRIQFNSPSDGQPEFQVKRRSALQKNECCEPQIWRVLLQSEVQKELILTNDGDVILLRAHERTLLTMCGGCVKSPFALLLSSFYSSFNIFHSTNFIFSH